MTDDTEANDRREIDRLTAAFFDVFSNTDGRRPALSRLLDLLHPSAVITKTCADTPTVDDVVRFIAPRERLLTDGTLTEFSERELRSRTDVFGSIAQRLSVYEKSGVLSGKPFRTIGVKSIQFIRTPGGWRITAVAWDDERDGRVVPPSIP